MAAEGLVDEERDVTDEDLAKMRYMVGDERRLLYEALRVELDALRAERKQLVTRQKRGTVDG